MPGRVDGCAEFNAVPPIETVEAEYLDITGWREVLDGLRAILALVHHGRLTSGNGACVAASVSLVSFGVHIGVLISGPIW